MPAEETGEVALRLDADADAFAFLAGRDTSLSAVVAQTRAAREAGRAVCWQVPLVPELVHRLEGLFSLARSEGAEPWLAPEDPLDASLQLFASDFVRYRLLGEEASGLSPERRRGYEALERELEGPTPRPSTEEDLSPLADMAGVIADGLRGLARFGMAAATPPRHFGEDVALPRVVLIGAYGGDHIGDTAILGGVLRRIRARHGTTHALLMSQRPAHTRRLAAMLDGPVEVRVEEYQHGPLRRGLEAADGLVYAGGPLTDIPKQLVRHLHAASLARRLGKPFLMEGVGVGPFPRRPSAWVGRRVARMAGRISVRTSEDGRQPTVSDLAPEIGRDPAFDYLESRGAELSKLPDADRRDVDRLLEGSEGRKRIALNIRPIGALYTEGVPENVDREAHTRAIEERFESELCDALVRFDAACDPRPCFVFYPMNAIQFGQSDLRSAYRIQRRLGGAVDFRVWQGDASIDGVVSLLRHVDLAIAMRFHGAIFALSQGCPVIGIDYRPGKRDKIGYLLGDRGQDENVARIDEARADWLVDRLQALLGKAPR